MVYVKFASCFYGGGNVVFKYRSKCLTGLQGVLIEMIKRTVSTSAPWKIEGNLYFFCGNFRYNHSQDILFFSPSGKFDELISSFLTIPAMISEAWITVFFFESK